MITEMTKKELKEMIKYYQSMQDNHKAANRMESYYEYAEKKCNCMHELARRNNRGW